MIASVSRGSIILLSLILAIVIRVCHLPRFDEKGFIGPDSARIIRQAKLISENGSLPERDGMRSAPLGRLNRYQLTFFPYLIVFLQRVLHLFGISLSLERIAVLSPVIFFAFACLMLYFFIKETLGQPVALMSVNIAAVLPVLTTRTMAGYVDRDALCLFLGLLSYYLYVKSYHSNDLKHRFLFSAASGFTMGALGLTWQGVALFSLVIVGVEVMRLLMQGYSMSDLYAYLCWAAPMLLVLLVVKRTYCHLSEPFAFLAVVPPILMLVLATAHIMRPLIPHGKFKVGCILGMVIISLIVLIWLSPLQILANLWENVNHPFGEGRLAEMIAELKKQGLIDWYIWPGIFFFAIAIGLFGTVFRLVRSLPINAWLTTLFFQVIGLGLIFSRVLSGVYASKDTFVSNIIYIISLLGLAFLIVAIYVRLKLRVGRWTVIKEEHDALFLLVYFLITLICARSAIRFDFFFAPIEIAFGSLAIVWLLKLKVGTNQINHVISFLVVVMLIWEFFALREVLSAWPLKLWLAFAILLTFTAIAVNVRRMWIARSSNKIFIRQKSIVWIIAVVMVFLTGPMQFALLSGYAKSSYDTVMEIHPFVVPKLERALTWLKNDTPQNSVIVASWEWGSSINLIANRSTIVDEEQLVPWVYMMYRSVFAGRMEREALRFLRAHDATHLLITARDINLIRQISYIGSDESLDLEITLPCFGVAVEQVVSDSGTVVYRYRSNESVSVEWDAPPETGVNVRVPWQVVGIYLGAEDSEQSYNLNAATLELRYEDYVIRHPPEQIFFRGKLIKNQGNVVPCTLLVSADSEDPFSWSILYLSEAARNSLAIRLYLLDYPSDFFHPVYPPLSAPVERAVALPRLADEYFARIWEINYPQDIVPHPKYSKTEFGNAPPNQSMKMKGGTP